MAPGSYDDPAAERTESRTFSRRSCLRGLLTTGGVLGVLGLSSPVSARNIQLGDGETDSGRGSSPRASVQDDGLTVTNLTSPDLAPVDLAQQLVAQGGGVDLSAESVSFDGDERAAGTFSGGGGILGFTEGIVLSTGQVSDVVGPNDASNTTTSLGTDGDGALDELAQGATLDAAILGFEFTVPEGVEQVTFDYIFGSEEYNEFVGTQFNDVFAFYVNGDNCAVVEDPDAPDGTSPVSINTINRGQPGVDPTNPSRYVNNDPFNPDADGEVVPEDELENTEMDGFTTVLTCTASVNPGETNTMRLAIADAGDAAYDSWVLLQAGSLTVPGECPDTDEASVTFTEQESDGTSVVVDSVSLENGGYVVIHAPDGSVLGHSEYLEPGAHEDVTVELDTPLDKDTVLTAMVHVDDGDKEYEFGSEEGVDGPYVIGEDCTPVADDGCIVVVATA